MNFQKRKNLDKISCPIAYDAFWEIYQDNVIYMKGQALLSGNLETIHVKSQTLFSLTNK